jgi:cytochrome b6
MGKPLSIENLVRWVDTRLDLSGYKKVAEKKVVPVHRQSFWYYLGGIVLLIIVVQFVTGALLMVYYVPEVKSAHRSILALNSQVDFGWFMRSFHSWGANLMILALFFHLFSTYFMKAYRPPREMTWWTGLALFGLAYGFGFTGYLLPWDQVSFFATKIGIDIAATTPVLGDQIALLLRGGETISQATLSRFFTIHVIVLPLLLLPLLGIHLFLVQQLGTSEPEWFQNRRPEGKIYEKFFPDFLLKDFVGWVATLGVIAILVALFPWQLGPEAQPFMPAPAGIKPEWYFLYLFQLLKLLPGHIGPIEGEVAGTMLFGLVVLSLALIPLWDRGGDSGTMARRGKLASIYGLILVILFVILTIWGFVA